jgi:glycosyltransferase involved in cell wall biosynthesis
VKILHLITGLNIGGAESALFNFLTAVCQNQTKYNSEHHVAFFHTGPNAAKIQSLGIPTYHITGWISPYDPVGYYKLTKLIRNIKPDILHTSLWSSNIIGRLLAQKFTIPLVSDLHGNCQAEGRLRNFFDRATVKHAGLIAAVSEDVKAAYINSIVNTVTSPDLQESIRSRMSVIKNSIDAKLLNRQAAQNPLSRESFGLSAQDFVIGSVGRLEPIKSYDLLIKACSLLPMKSFKLMLVGDGSESIKLKNLVLELNLTDHVIFTGAQSDAYRFYPLFDCFALSSQSEGLSIALLESLAFGLPIITTHNNQHHEVVTHMINGLLVPHNSPEALAAGLETIRSNLSLRTSMRTNNQALAAQQLDIDAVVSSFFGLYHKSLANLKINTKNML